MKKLADLLDRELKWTQPATLKMHYELNAGDELAATLRFRSLFGSLATGESGDGCWTFKRAGFFQTRATIRVCGEEADIAVFKHNTWSGGGALELQDGRKMLATTNLWQSNLEFKTESGEVLLRFQSAGLMHLSALVEIRPEAIGLAELPWMVMFGWYLIVMMHMDSAAAVAAVG
ncbi:MAG TPA: hypothetical protein VNO24_00055 [Blastocatellia bacterium]|nr:hypothetical protein [Blastocatellia bacterium]